MAQYYLSNDGDDNSDGSITNPWASLNKINSLKAGDSIYLRCDNIFYGNIVTPNLTSSSAQVTVSSYGMGKKPIVSCYKLLNIASAWVQDSTNIWKIDLSNTNNFTGCSTVNVNIGFIKVDDNIKGYKKWAKTDLTSQWQFYSDNSQYLYVYSTANPTTLAKDIRVAPAINILYLSNSAKVMNLELCGSGGHGVSSSSENSYLSNCDIHELGGSELIGYDKLRYGNGIEFWATAQNMTVEYNNIYDCYDVAFTMQGQISGIGFKNIVYQNNIDWNNNQSFEVWSTGSSEGMGYTNCKYRNNISINAGRGWSWSVRPDVQTATSLYLQMMEAPCNDIVITDNIFYNPRQGVLCSRNISNGDVPSGYVSNNNYIFLNQRTTINNHKTYTIEQYASYIDNTGLDSNSQFFILPITESSTSDIISVMMGLLAKNNAQIKLLQNSISNLNKKIEDYMNLNVIGIKAPTITPTFIGQEFIDTTNRKVYRAVGLTSSDWVVLN